MPFIRQSRDKRGFDHTYVMHIGRAAGGHQQTRVLYVFRSPANLQVGRKALDAEVREALEHTHPDLNFDWNALTRDAIVTRPDPGQRQGRQGRQGQQGQAPQDRGVRTRSAPPTPASSPAPQGVGSLPYQIPADDPSVLAQAIGVAEAARLRHRHRELVHRIGRRARTPEERGRLLERAGRLNPDSWTDEPTIRAQVPLFDREVEAIAAELPSRRRGRRGGRRRPEEPEEAGSGSSGIMAEDTDAQVDSQSDATGAGGGDRVGAGRTPDDPDPGPDPETGVPRGD